MQAVFSSRTGAACRSVSIGHCHLVFPSIDSFIAPIPEHHCVVTRYICWKAHACATYNLQLSWGCARTCSSLDIVLDYRFRSCQALYILYMQLPRPCRCPPIWANINLDHHFPLENPQKFTPTHTDAMKSIEAGLQPRERLVGRFHQPRPSTATTSRTPANLV